MVRNMIQCQSDSVGFQPLNITSEDLNCLSHSSSPRAKVSLTLEELLHLQREREREREREMGEGRE